MCVWCCLGLGCLVLADLLKKCIPPTNLHPGLLPHTSHQVLPKTYSAQAHTAPCTHKLHTPNMQQLNSQIHTRSGLAKTKTNWAYLCEKCPSEGSKNEQPAVSIPAVLNLGYLSPRGTYIVSNGNWIYGIEGRNIKKNHRIGGMQKDPGGKQLKKVENHLPYMQFKIYRIFKYFKYKKLDHGRIVCRNGKISTA